MPDRDLGKSVPNPDGRHVSCLITTKTYHYQEDLPVNTPLLLSLALAAVLAASPAERSLAGKPLPPAAPFDLEQQVLRQGPMLLGNLRQAPANGLRRDPTGRPTANPAAAPKSRSI